MANTSIQLRKSGVTGNTPADLKHGELAVNYADAKLFYKNSLGNIEYITNQDSFATISANSTLVLATSPTDILSINPSGNSITITGNVSNKSVDIGLNESAITSFVRKSGDTMSGSLTGVTTLGASSLSMSHGEVTSNTYTTSSTTQVSVDSFSTTTYRSVKYLLQVTSGSDYHVLESRILHNGINVWMNQYGEIITGTSLGTFDATITSGVLNLLFTGTNDVSTIKLVREAIHI
jgi:hypothetical protein